MSEYIHYGHKNFNLSSFIKIKNIEYNTKPQGGLWASKIDAKYGWKNWCKDNSFCNCKKENSFSFVLLNTARVLYINYVKDLKSLPKAEDKLGLNFLSWILLDFEELAKTYNAIEVNISNDFDLYYKLYGWDCDSILVMNPNVIVEK